MSSEHLQRSERLGQESKAGSLGEAWMAEPSDACQILNRVKAIDYGERLARSLVEVYLRHLQYQRDYCDIVAL